ncbi:MAG: hypothetical protein M1832_003042 [Thelocarpon impressellum]|nr:MAG: hypothetical protein M1832_003042 [Thelocarpon impressellum]
MSLAGPLSKVFTPDARCFSTISDLAGNFRLIGAESTQCFPKSWATDNWYSPGRCPDAYTGFTVTTAVNGLSPGDDEHVYNCCPQDMTVDANAERGCRSAITVEATVTYGTWNFTGNADGVTRTSTISRGFPVYVNAYPVQVRFQNSDISNLGLQSSDLSRLYITSGPTATPTRSGSRSRSGSSPVETGADSRASPAPRLSTGGGGLSQGTRIAIGVLVPLVVIALAVAGFLYLRALKMRRAAAAAAATRPDFYPLPMDMAEEGKTPEMSSDTPPTELDGVKYGAWPSRQQFPMELDATKPDGRP